MYQGLGSGRGLGFVLTSTPEGIESWLTDNSCSYNLVRVLVPYTSTVLL